MDPEDQVGREVWVDPKNREVCADPVKCVDPVICTDPANLVDSEVCADHRVHRSVARGWALPGSLHSRSALQP